MKKIILASLVAVSGIFAITFNTSCQKDYNASPADDTTTVRNPFQGDFTCLIGGAPFDADVMYYTDTNINGMRAISVSAQQFSPNRSPLVYQTFAFTITPYEATGMYRIDQGAVSGSYIKADSTQTLMYNIVAVDTFANVTTTSDADNLAGTFSLYIRPVGATDNTQDLTVSIGEFDIPKN